MSVLLLQPLNMTSRAGANAPQLVTGGNVQSLQVVVAEGAVCDHVGRDGNKLNQLAFRSDDIDSSFELVGRLSRGFRVVESGRHVQPTFRIDSHPVRASVAAPIEQKFLARRVDCSVLFQIETPELAIVGRLIVLVISDVEKLLVR